jgi:formyl-CoA transferase
MDERPLEDLTVIDCATLIAGPMAGMFMADFGADVIKIEHPEFGDSSRNWGREDQELVWKWMGRNKRSVALDLSSPEGQEIMTDLVADADVLIEAFRPGTMESWGLGWETLSEVNPDLVMVRTSGFGQTGPYTNLPGFGTLAESMSGFAEVTGFPDKPPTLPSLGLADAVAACYSTFATMFALYWRDLNDGHGQYIDTSLLEPLFSVMGRITTDYSVNGTLHTRKGNRSSFTVPRNTYQTKDGEWISLSGSAESIARRILRTVGGEDLADDPRFRTNDRRLEHSDEVDERIAAWAAERTREEALAAFEEHDAAAAPVYDVADIFDDSYFWERDALVDVDDDDHDDLVLPGVFPHLSETPGRIEWSGASLGEHTVEVLAERTDVDAAELADLRERGVVATDE